MRSIQAVLSVLMVAFLGACGGGEPVAISAEPTQDETVDTGGEEEPADVDFVVTGVDVDVFCPSMDRITDTLDQASDLAGTAGQEDAQQNLWDDIDAVLLELDDDYPELTERLDVLAIEGIVFEQEANTEVDLDVLREAGQYAIDVWKENCATYVQGEDPDPEEFGADGQEDDFDAECPAPEVLEAEGLECDSRGNLSPADTPADGHGGGDECADDCDEEFDAECPAPEVLEAEGLECDSEGNLYSAQYPDAHDQGEECGDFCDDEPYQEPGADGCEGDDCYGDEEFYETNPDDFGGDGCEDDDC